MRSARRPASPRKWVQSTTVRPCSVASEPMRSMTSRVAAGSSPDVGSSRNSTSGSCSSARASASRLRCPVEVPCTGRSARSAMPKRSSSSSVRRSAQPPVEAAHAAGELEVLACREALVEAGVLGEHAGAAAHARRRRRPGRARARVARPRSGRRMPLSSRTVVVLPAPFGPEQREHLARLHVEGQAVEGDAARERAGQVAGLDGGGHRRQSRRVGRGAAVSPCSSERSGSSTAVTRASVGCGSRRRRRAPWRRRVGAVAAAAVVGGGRTGPVGRGSARGRRRRRRLAAPPRQSHEVVGRVHAPVAGAGHADADVVHAGSTRLR